MLQHLQWEQLQHQLTRQLPCHHFVQNNQQSIVDINLSESHLQLTNSITRGHPLRLMQLQTNLDCYKHSFLPHAIKI